MLAFVVSGFVPAAAVAATAQLRCLGERQCVGVVVDYQASAGEANRVRIGRVDLDRVSIRDEGAAIVAGEGCESLSPHEVVCGPAQSVRAALGDGDDEFQAASGPPRLGASVDGGAGDDRIEAAGSLDGGGGHDVLIGSDYGDELADGDSPRAPDADVLDGGGGVDTVNYSARRSAVVVDLSRNRPTGERGEGDVIQRIEGVRGGSGNDRLIGRVPEAGAGVVLEGGDGNDLLVGTAVSDYIDPGSGADRTDGRGGDDEFALYESRRTHVADVVRCGAGSDVVDLPESPDYIAASCERPVFAGPFLDSLLAAGTDGRRPVFGTRAGCGTRGGCSFDVRIVARGSGRRGAPAAGTILGRRELAVRYRDGARVGVRLDSEARRALRRARRLPILVAVSAHGFRASFRSELLAR